MPTCQKLLFNNYNNKDRETMAYETIAIRLTLCTKQRESDLICTLLKVVGL